jgi:uncharacterized lipoprotein YmbA
MMKYRLHSSLAAVLMFFAILSSGCINLGKSTDRETRLYVLTALASASDGIAFSGQASATIGVGPLAFPDYLDRPQLVTRVNESEVVAAPFANWAEPLKQNVIRILVDNLATITHNGGVYRYPWRAGYAPQFQLQMAIDRFDAVRNGDAFLTVSWEWLDQGGKPLMARERSVLHQPVKGDGDEAIVTAMSRLLLVFSRLAASKLSAFQI